MQEYDTTMVIYYLVGGIITIVLQVAFCWALYTAMSKVPENKQVTPAWLPWLILLPVVGFIIAWITIPFTIPKSLTAALEGNAEAQQQCKKLGTIGLWNLICATLVFIPLLGFVLAVAAFVLWIMYWLKINDIRNKYLEAGVSPAASDPAVEKPSEQSGSESTDQQ